MSNLGYLQSNFKIPCLHIIERFHLTTVVSLHFEMVITH